MTYLRYVTSVNSADASRCISGHIEQAKYVESDSKPLALRPMPTPSPPLTRRSLLALGGAGTLGWAVGTGPSPKSHATTAQELTVTGSASEFPTFSEDFGRRFVNALPNVVELESPVPVGGATIRVTFDPRLLALSDRAAQLVTGENVVSTPVTVEDGSITIGIPDHVHATHVVVGLPFFTVVRYPAENAGASTAPTAHVTLGAHVADCDFPLDQPIAQGLAWGGEIDVAWRRQSVGDETDYFVPGLLTLTSVGPGPIPAGTRIRIQTDSVLADEVRPASVPPVDSEPDLPVAEPDPSAAAPTTTISTAQADGARSTDVVLEEELAAGTAFTSVLEGGGSTARVRVKAVTFAQVSVEPPEDSRAMQRVTGAETVTSLAPGGLPLAADMLMGSI